MGISCKPIGKMKGILKKIQNEQEKEARAKVKIKKPKKENIED